MAFASDGRLMACAGSQTDAILVFTRGGRCVRRFAEIVPYGGLATDAYGQVYVAGGQWHKNPVHVFGPQGDLRRTVGSAESKLEEDTVYVGVAVDRTGRIYVANARDGVIEVYDPEGARVNTIRSDQMQRPWRLALGLDGRLYVIENTSAIIRYHPAEGGRTIHVFEAHTGATLGTVPAPPGVCLSTLTFGPNGHLFAGGYWA